METERYIVTAVAGPKVAGRRVEAGAILELTENAARAELLAGTIVREIVRKPAQTQAIGDAVEVETETTAPTEDSTETTAPKSKKR